MIAALLAAIALMQSTAAAAVAVDPPRDAAHLAAMTALAIPSDGTSLNEVLYTAAGAGPHPTAYVAQSHGALFGAPSLSINDRDYFAWQGLNVMVFGDYYPDGHQTGVTVIQHCTRGAANGDIRLETLPGQCRPYPRTESRAVSGQSI